MRNNEKNLTDGPILSTLVKFALPILVALFLQAMYGAADLLIIGKFATKADVSAVATGSQIMQTLTAVITSFAMGTTVLLGQKIGERDRGGAGRIAGASLVLFFVIGAVLTIAIGAGAGGIASVMQAPAHAFAPTVAYIRICGAGSVAIVLYNYIGAVFRGMGDSATPVITVTIACVFNIGGDLIMVAGFHAGAAGAAGATVAAQIISVAASFVIIRHKKLPFDFDRRMFRWNTALSANITSVGLPVALQDFLVSVSFLIILAIVNSLGLVASAGVGVAEKVCTFIMLVPSCFMQSVAAFVAQNNGAGKEERGFLALRYAIRISVPMAILMFYFTFFHGDVLAGMFSGDGDVISAAADYLKAYAIDCLLTCFLFSFVGYFNGMARTKFVMVQGLIGAFCVRVPVSFLMAQVRPVSLFHIGLATPCSTILQIVLSAAYLYLLRRRELEGTLQA